QPRSYPIIFFRQRATDYVESDGVPIELRATKQDVSRSDCCLLQRIRPRKLRPLIRSSHSSRERYHCNVKKVGSSAERIPRSSACLISTIPSCTRTVGSNPRCCRIFAKDRL